VPPDYFSADGQLWGNPLYAWKRHESDGFAWWIARIEAALSLYDMVRIDHFRGLAACWAVPAGEKTARNGVWEPAPGAALLAALAGKLGMELPIVAEDLGFITEDVIALRTRFGLPGMRILQFGFDSRESGRGLDPQNPFLPHNYVPDCVAYTGTHDNDTLAGWLESASSDERAFIGSYLGYVQGDTVQALLREAMKSAAGLAIFPMQDLLGLGSKARMNTPSTIGGNWSWRLTENPVAGDRRSSELANLAWLYGRTLRGD
jgi:4-alpha-glucanotransferase